MRICTFQKKIRRCGTTAGMVAIALAAPSISLGAAGYSGTITGAFSNPVVNGTYINQTKGANAQTPPNFNFVNRNNTGTAVTNINNANPADAFYTWGNAIGLNPQPAVTSSRIDWAPQAFNNVAPGVRFLIGKLTYTNGTINLATDAFGGTLKLSGLNITDNTGAALPVAVTGLTLPFQNWDTINLTSGYAGAVKGLAGNNVVDAAGNLFDNTGAAINDSLGNQVTVPGPSFYDTFWSADYLSFQPAGPFANFSNTNDTGTFEGQSAVFDVYGKIVGDPQIEIDSIVLDDSSLGSGFAVPSSEEEAGVPEPTSLAVVGSVALFLSRRRVRKSR